MNYLLAGFIMTFSQATYDFAAAES